MGYHFFMYRCSGPEQAFTRWKSDAAEIPEPIGTPEATWVALTELLPTLVRERQYESSAGWYGSATTDEDPYNFSVSTTVNRADSVTMIVTEHRAPPSVLRRIMQRFRLDACCDSHGRLIDPSAYDDRWRPLHT